MKKQFKYFHFGFVILLSIGLYNCKSDKSSIPEGFEIENGYDLTLVASEPLIKDPVDIEFDEYGDAYVLEMPGYPFEDKESNIVKLEDENEDGIFEAGITYAEDLQLASSILPYKKGMLVAAPPYLLYIQDTDRDGKADLRDTLLDGFSTGNLQHNYNGLTYGLDGWIYAANGGNSGKPFWYGDSTTVVDLKGDDLRIDIDGRQIERLGRSSGGYELAINEWGHLFETHNLEHVSQLVFPSRYIGDTKLAPNHTLVNISDHEENGLARIYPIGEQESRVNHPEQSGYFSGSCGVTYYGGGAFGGAYDNSVWVADVVLNLLHVDQLQDHGSRSEGKRILEKRDFLASTDRSFRPVNMTAGPDGSMYVVDMYREVIEHPEWIPDEMEAKMDLEAGKDKGRIYKISNQEANHQDIKGLNLETVEGALSELGNKNQWIRNTAHRILMEKDLNEKVADKLKQHATGNNKYAILHSMWLLHNKEELSLEILIKNLGHSEPGVKENALIIAENYLSDKSVLQSCIKLLNDDHQRVKMQAGLTMSTLPDQIFENNKEEIITQILNSTVSSMDEWNIMAATLAAKGAKSVLFKQISKSDLNDQKENLLEALALATSSQEKNVVEILNCIHDEDIAAPMKVKIANSISAGFSNQRSSNKLSQAISKLETKADLPLVTSLALLRNKANLPPSRQFLAYSKQSLRSVLDNDIPTEERSDHLSVLALLPYSQKDKILMTLISNKEPISIQEASLEQIWKADDKKVGKKLVDEWENLGPQARRIASDILLYKELHHDALLTGLENGKINIGEMNFDLERRRTLLWWTDDERTKKRAEALFSDAGVVNRKEVIHKLSPALSLAGNKINGEELFDNLCGQCHLYQDRGQDVGPVLTEINRKSKASLMHDILDPNAAVDTRYINHKLETNDGTIHIGIVESETDHEVSIKKLGGSMVTIDKQEVKTLSSLGSSMMPEGMEGNLDVQEMADLLAFLQEGE